MYKVAVLGDRDSIYGFSAIGLDVFYAADPVEAGKKLRELAGGDYAVIYVTEALAESIKAELDHYSFSPLPAIIPIPGVAGNTGIGMNRVKEFVEQAVGSDIIFNDKN